ncbi:MAG: hypothetical protein ACLPZR_05805 [Solirubrobacteraceae bacterium]
MSADQTDYAGHGESPAEEMNAAARHVQAALAIVSARINAVILLPGIKVDELAAAEDHLRLAGRAIQREANELSVGRAGTRAR